jgi:putative flippase GtrA
VWRSPVVRFYAVGAAGIVVQLAALAIFKTGLRIDYLPATALAVEVALLHNFFWHELWTWADRTRSLGRGRGRRLIRFHLTNGALSILLNLVCMRFLVGRMQLPYLLANAMTITLCSLLNFLAADRFVFRSLRDSRDQARATAMSCEAIEPVSISPRGF